MTLSAATILLFLVMDPLGNIPVFLVVLKKFTIPEQRKIIAREVIIAFFILVIFLFFGRYILNGLHISAPALSIAGSLVLFIIALRMIFPHHGTTHSDVANEEPFIVPLAIPLTAGPSALAIVLLYSTREPEHLWLWFTAIVIATIAFLLIMLLAPNLMHILKKRGLIAIERLMGMILTALAVEMFLSGINDWLEKIVT